MSVQIINLRTKEPYDFRCDRKSPIGNPYVMNDESERDKVCEEYEMLFDQTMNDWSLDPNTVVPGTRSTTVQQFRNYIDNIVGYHRIHGHVTLACWCVPKKCHCETIKRWIENPW